MNRRAITAFLLCVGVCSWLSEPSISKAFLRFRLSAIKVLSNSCEP